MEPRRPRASSTPSRPTPLTRGIPRATGSPIGAWDFPSFDDCTDRQLRLGEERLFQVSRRTETNVVSFRTPWGHGFNTVLYLYRAGGAGSLATHSIFGVRRCRRVRASTAWSTRAPISWSSTGLRRVGPLRASRQRHARRRRDATSAAEPNYDEASAAYHAIGGKVVGVDCSGYACDDGPTSFHPAQHRDHARAALARYRQRRRAAASPTGLACTPSAGLCHAGDPPIDAAARRRHPRVSRRATHRAPS